MSDFNEMQVLWTDFFEKYSDIEFHENPSSRSEFHAAERTDMTKLIVVFRGFGNVPKTT